MAGVSKQSLSNHLTCLRGCGLVVAVPEGRRVRYELADPKLGDALTALLDVGAVSDIECCCPTSSTHVDGRTCCS
jgi:DNA-binding transcriptional ArsR family regulator